ncbi:Rieske (2Fe-2S) protein [Mobilicoccus massiliensis]|uniref:Rieske (2Fe-2S) protein n=1 Tax=Mobilicoccus massiliensis TaxID=1522310 RepID=UPI0015965CD0|nr:Rieske (2Fe-2S) protein [Mobilicoccus massiliensis]
MSDTRANSPNPPTTPSRRTVLKIAGAGGAIATVTFVSACGSGEKKSEAPDKDNAKVQAAVQQAVTSGQVPVGGAAFLTDVGAVVTQPTTGQYKVFSTWCPHAGAEVTMLDEKTGRIVCVLHGSQFDPTTGEVKVGPSPAGLKPIEVAVSAPTPTA